MNNGQESLHHTVTTKVKEILDTNVYIIESQIDTMSDKTAFVTFKMAKDLKYPINLFCDFANILHAQQAQICVKRGFLTLVYIINDDKT